MSETLSPRSLGVGSGRTVPLRPKRTSSTTSATTMTPVCIDAIEH